MYNNTTRNFRLEGNNISRVYTTSLSLAWAYLCTRFCSVNALLPGLGQEIWANQINSWPRFPGLGQVEVRLHYKNLVQS
jgi:hypothetical protein